MIRVVGNSLQAFMQNMVLAKIWLLGLGMLLTALAIAFGCAPPRNRKGQGKS